MYRRRVDVCWLAPCSRTSTFTPSGWVIARLPIAPPSGCPSLSSWRRGGLGREPRALVLADQAGLPDPDVEMIPREDLVDGPLPLRVEGGIPWPFPQRGPPVALEAGGLFEEVGDPAVAASQEGLEERFAWVLVEDSHVVETAHPGLDGPELR